MHGALGDVSVFPGAGKCEQSVGLPRDAAAIGFQGWGGREDIKSREKTLCDDRV